MTRNERESRDLMRGLVIGTLMSAVIWALIVLAAWLVLR